MTPEDNRDYRRTLESRRRDPWYPFASQEQQDQYNREVMAPYQALVAEIATPHENPAVEQRKLEAYGRLFAAVFPQQDTSQAELEHATLAEFRTLVHSGLRECVDAKVRAVNTTPEGKLVAMYARTGDNRNIITPQQGTILIETFGLQDGVPPASLQAYARERGSNQGQPIRYSRIWSLRRLEASLTVRGFLDRHPLPPRSRQ